MKYVKITYLMVSIMLRIKKGFSLIESLFSIAIISIVLVMVCIFYTYMMKVSSKGLAITVASQVAEEKLNRIASIYGDSNSLSMKNITQFPYIKTGYDLVGNTKFYYLIKVSDMNTNSFYGSMNLYFADVVVFWLPDDVIVKEEEGTQVTIDNNQEFLKNLETKFKADNITEDLLINTFVGKTTNLNEGYRFVRLSRLVSNS